MMASRRALIFFAVMKAVEISSGSSVMDITNDTRCFPRSSRAMVLGSAVARTSAIRADAPADEPARWKLAPTCCAPDGQLEMHHSVVSVVCWLARHDLPGVMTISWRRIARASETSI